MDGHTGDALNVGIGAQQKLVWKSVIALDAEEHYRLEHRQFIAEIEFQEKKWTRGSTNLKFNLIQLCRMVSLGDPEVQEICQSLVEKYGEPILEQCVRKGITGADFFYHYQQCQESLPRLVRNVTEDIAQQALMINPFSRFNRNHLYPEGETTAPNLVQRF